MTAPEVALVPVEEAIELPAPVTENQAVLWAAAAEVERSKIAAAAAKEIGNTQWGSSLSPVATAAIARWALAVGLDPLRHIEMLGGKIYDRAELYIDKLAADPNFDYAEVVIMAPLSDRNAQFDKMLEDKTITKAQAKDLREKQATINHTRLGLQIQHEVPSSINAYPDSAAAVLVRLHFSDGRFVSGVNWAGSMGRVGKYEKGIDPVGDKNALKTAITRAYRKAAKQCVPVWFGQTKSSLEEVEFKIAQGRAALKAGDQEPPAARIPVGNGKTIPVTSGGPSGPPLAGGDDPYDDDKPPVVDVVPLVCPECGNQDDGPIGSQCSAECTPLPGTPKMVLDEERQQLDIDAELAAKEAKEEAEGRG